MNRTRHFLFFFSLLMLPFLASATHNRAGEITYSQLDELTIECVVTTYTKESSTNADRDSILVLWGDGIASVLYRENGPDEKGEPLGNDIKKNVYRGKHTYPGRGTYIIGMQDPNRVADVVNVPNSVNVKFFISTTVTLLNPQFQGKNNSAILLEPPIDFGCISQPFVHNPNASDPDGDSLSFELIVPFQGKDTTINGYQYPDQILPGPDNVIRLDPKSGEFTWLFPKRAGEFNIAFRVNEYRNGFLISSIIRDMQIEILDCDNAPPEITAEEEICIVAGDTIDILAIARDLSIPPDEILLTASGGPLSVSSSPAIFTAPSDFSPGPIQGNFFWATTCEHIRKEAYTVVFKAVDRPSTFPPLADLHTLSIKVVAPPPQDVEGNANQDQIVLSWAAPYICENVKDEYFYGFSIWRRIGSKDVRLDTCRPGLEGQGYTLLDYQFSNVVGGKHQYIDDSAEKGRTYCYRILAEFARKSSGGYPFNFVQSLTSEEVCLQLSRDQPLLLNVDVTETDNINGEIYVRWTRPVAKELDTLKHPGPYVYEVLRRERNNGNFAFVPGSRIEGQFWQSPIDTFFTDTGLNTTDFSYEYKIAFNSAGPTEVKESEPATSIFLSIGETDRQLNLSWSEKVPWENKLYEILMHNNLGTFDTIGSTSDTFFLVKNLKNDTAYCLKVLAYGDYGLTELNQVLLNHSQINCGTPIDTVPPCSPEISVTNPCEEQEDIDEDDFYNIISWNDPIFICENSSDIGAFIIYFRSQDDQMWGVLDTLEYGSGFEYRHDIGALGAGCYAVTSIDTSGNESRITGEVCIDNCPLYILPNTFTPNGNGQNDLFVPRQKRFIDHVEFAVFNRWGELVFETTDPEINWNGNNLKGQPLVEGTYFYSCIVYESHYTGPIRQEQILKGFIDIIRRN